MKKDKLIKEYRGENIALLGCSNLFFYKNNIPDWAKGKNTKLFLYSDYPYTSIKENHVLSRLPSLSYLNQILGYNFQIEIPVVRAQEVTEEYKTIFGKTKTRSKGSDIYLVFSKELSEEELKFWRIFIS